MLGYCMEDLFWRILFVGSCYEDIVRRILFGLHGNCFFLHKGIQWASKCAGRKPKNFKNYQGAHKALLKGACGVRLSAKYKLQQHCPHDLSIIFCWERSGPSGNLDFVQLQGAWAGLKPAVMRALAFMEPGVIMV